MQVSERLADVLDVGYAVPPDHELRVLVDLAELLRRRSPVRPDPVFRRQLRRRLLDEFRDPAR